MLDLIRSSIDAHGGLERWNDISQISADLVPGGLALQQRGQAAFAKSPTRVTIETQRQHAVFSPFLSPDQTGIFEPHRTAVASTAGQLLEELHDPRGSFEPDHPWSAAQLAYFAGYALWTYLTLPFSLLSGDIRLDEISPWNEGDETWRAVKVTFPQSYVTHSSEQVLYFDANGLIRRHDYSVDIAGGGTAAHYLYDHQPFGGIIFPTRRRIYARGADQKPNKDIVLMSADLSGFALSTAS
jgi:hypothetical protein